MAADARELDSGSRSDAALADGRVAFDTARRKLMIFSCADDGLEAIGAALDYSDAAEVLRSELDRLKHNVPPVIIRIAPDVGREIGPLPEPFRAAVLDGPDCQTTLILARRLSFVEMLSAALVGLVDILVLRLRVTVATQGHPECLAALLGAETIPRRGMTQLVIGGRQWCVQAR